MAMSPSVLHSFVKIRKECERELYDKKIISSNSVFYAVNVN
jgi:hypothetical protein